MSLGGRDRDRQSIGQLVAVITEDLAALIRGEIDLAKAEVRESAAQAGRGAGLLAGAAFLAFFAFVFLLVAAAYGLVAAGLPVWAGFLIVAVVLLLIAVILGAVGKRHFDRVKGPERAKVQKEETRRVLSSVPQRFKDANERASKAETIVVTPPTPTPPAEPSTAPKPPATPASTPTPTAAAGEEAPGSPAASEPDER